MFIWNLRIDLLDEPDFACASMVAKGTWLSIMATCVRLTNGGILEGAASWEDGRWLMVCRVHLSDVEEAISAGLMVRRGGSVEVVGYPVDSEASYLGKRARGQVSSPQKAAAARANGRLGGRPRKSGDDCDPETHTQNPKKTQASPNPKSSTSETAPENPTKEKVENKKRSGKKSKAPTTSSLSKQETEEQWIRRLSDEYPCVDIQAELEKALHKYRRGIDRNFFETSWLPKVSPKVQIQPPNRKPPPDQLPEPNGWQEIVMDSRYGPEGPQPVSEWRELPKEVQEFAMKELKKKAAVPNAA